MMASINKPSSPAHRRLNASPPRTGPGQAAGGPSKAALDDRKADVERKRCRTSRRKKENPRPDAGAGMRTWILWTQQDSNLRPHGCECRALRAAPPGKPGGRAL